MVHLRLTYVNKSTWLCLPPHLMPSLKNRGKGEETGMIGSEEGHCGIVSGWELGSKVTDIRLISVESCVYEQG